MFWRGLTAFFISVAIVAGFFAANTFAKSFFSAARDVIAESFARMKGVSREHLAAEIPLSPVSSSSRSVTARGEFLQEESASIKIERDVEQFLKSGNDEDAVTGISGKNAATENAQSAASATLGAEFANNVSTTVVINEIFYDEEGSDDGKEFIELLNRGAIGADIKRWRIVYNGKAIATIGGTSNDVTLIPAGGYFLIGFSNYNGTPIAQAVRSVSLVNSAGTAELYDANGVLVDFVSFDGLAMSGESVAHASGTNELYPSTPSPGK